MYRHQRQQQQHFMTGGAPMSSLMMGSSPTVSSTTSGSDQLAEEMRRTPKSFPSPNSSSTGPMFHQQGGGSAATPLVTPNGVHLVDATLMKLRVAKIFKQHTDSINSLNFTTSGDLLIASGDDDQIIIYDAENGTQKRTLHSKKYGVDLISFTHHKNNVIHSSTKIDDTIRYLSLHDNKYLRYFTGHKNRVTTLCLSPVNDSLLSGSADKTVRLWDLRSQNCQGLMHLAGKPVAGFDQQGLVFAVGIGNGIVKLYDIRSFDKGPFATFLTPDSTLDNKEAEWTTLKFSPDGKYVMITTKGSVIRILDAYSGEPVYTLTASPNPDKIHIDAAFTPDSRYVVSGSAAGVVHIWNLETGYKICVLNGDHPQPLQRILFNPQYMMMATACTNMAFWIPQGLREF